MATKKKIVKETKGTHLTVTEYSDGSATLVWDDEQLLKEVKEAIAAGELAAMKPAVRAKAAPRKAKAK